MNTTHIPLEAFGDYPRAADGDTAHSISWRWEAAMQAYARQKPEYPAAAAFVAKDERATCSGQLGPSQLGWPRRLG